MALKMRLRKQGRTHRPFYRIVITDSEARRDGKYKESLGWYDPMRTEENIQLNAERAEYWVANGVQPTEKVVSLLKQAAPNAAKALSARGQKKKKAK